MGKFDDAAKVNHALLEAVGDDESAVVMDASLAALRGQWSRACTRSAIAVSLSSHRADYHLALAESATHVQAYDEGISACRRALELDPTSVPARSLFIRLLLAIDENAAAREELARLIALAPAGRDMWEDWFARQSRAAAR